MSRAIPHISLIITILFSQLYNSVISAFYHANKAYYATVLCTEKNNPNSICEGSCFFSIQISLKSETVPQNSILHFSDSPPLFCDFHEIIVLQHLSDTKPIKVDKSNINKLSESYRMQIDHPPEIRIPS